MYFYLSSEIRIENATTKVGKTIRGVNDVTIQENIHEYANKCTIKLPPSITLKYSTSQPDQPGVQTAAQFKRGEKVIVKLGYSGQLRQEFVGFVSRINRTTPVEIECEGYSWQLRNKKNIKKSWKTTTTKDVLQYLIQGTDIVLHDKIPAIPLKNLAIFNASGTEVLDYLIDLLKGTCTAFFIDNVLFFGLTYTDITEQTVKYQQGKNVISDDSLKYHQADDVTVKIEFKHKATDGTEAKKTSVGLNGGLVKTETVSAVDDQGWLNKMAQAKLQQETFDGYEGEITAFLIPYCRTGYRINYTSAKYPEKNGNYFCEGLTINFGLSGARRIPQLGLKLS